jgi:hypothetical protein
MSNPTCSVDGCAKPRKRSSRMCSMHRARLTRTGTTDPGPLARPRSQRFWELTHKAEPDACWRWVGPHHSEGYGLFASGYAHRFSWELHSGEKIPAGMHIDHKCHVRDCVNPAHLQVVTLTENNQNHNGARRNSQTGIRGVSWCHVMKKWKAGASHAGETLCRYFDDIEDAAAAVIEMRNTLHTNNLADRR